MSTDELISLAQGGDKSAKTRLWASVRRWVVLLCRKYLEIAKLSGNELDDLINTAYIGFDKALYKFEPEKGYAFTTFLTFCVRKEIRQYLNLRSGTEIIKPVSLDEAVDEENGLTRLDMLADEHAREPFGRVESDISAKWIIEKAGRLSDKQQKVMTWFYRDRIPMKVIAKRLNVSATGAEQVKTAALRKLRQAPELPEYYAEFGYRQVGIKEFRSTHISSVEWAVLKLETERNILRRLEKCNRK